VEQMSSYTEFLLEKYKAKGLLIDANLLLLYLVGSYDVRLIGDGKYNKLSKYVVEDFELLVRLIRIFKTGVTTAHVLTEVSNLTGDLPESTKAECLGVFGRTFADMHELVVPNLDVAKRPEFCYLGLTDSVLAQLSNEVLIVSDDGRLVAKLSESGLEALNFNHLRLDHLLSE
jgi:hypothetical protein